MKTFNIVSLKRYKHTPSYRCKVKKIMQLFIKYEVRSGLRLMSKILLHLAFEMCVNAELKMIVPDLIRLRTVLCSTKKAKQFIM